MRKIMRVLVSALLVSINLFGPDGEAFEEKARAFLAGIDWSQAGGFSLRIRADKAPLVLCDAKRMNVKMGALVGLGNGKTYTLTNGRGRMQTFSVESKVNPVDWMKGALTGDVSFLNPWGYAFVWPLAILLVLIVAFRRVCMGEVSGLTGLYAALGSALVSCAVFVYILSLSRAPNFSWHLGTAFPRLVWMPTVLLLAEILRFPYERTFHG